MTPLPSVTDTQPSMPTVRMDHNVSSSPYVTGPVDLPDIEPRDTASPPQVINGFNTTSTLNSLAVPRERAEVGRPVRLELKDGTIYSGFGFGADKSVSGELVFQTGMVGYPESVTDPSYKGQILVFTFPLAGNYGVPSRDTMDEILGDLPAHFEASQIHVSGLVVASYAGEDYSHHLATSSLGTWLKEQGIPAMYGVDTRALTKRIREEGSMLGKMMIEANHQSNATVNGQLGHNDEAKALTFEYVEWDDPNTKNVVADGERAHPGDPPLGFLISFTSLYPRASSLHSTCEEGFVSSVGPTSQSCLRRCGTQIQSASLLGFQRSGGPGCPVGL